MRESRCPALVALAAAGAIACGGTDPSATPTTLTIFGGDGQVAEVGQPLPESLAVVVRTASGLPAPGVVVFWQVTMGDGSVSPVTSVTNANGVARAQLVVGMSVGRQEVVAIAPPLLDATFSSTARLNGAVNLAVRTIGPFTDTTLGTNDQPLVVMVTNEKNEPVPGFVVTWTASAGGSVSESTQPTDAGGESIVSFTYGPMAGDQFARATAPGLIGSPIDFAMRATAGNAVSIEKISGDGLSVPAGGQVIHRVIARDARGNPRNGVAIHWSVASGGGSITPSQNFTGNDGTAEALRTLGPNAGSQTAVATAPDVAGTPSVTFTTTASALRGQYGFSRAAASHGSRGSD